MQREEGERLVWAPVGWAVGVKSENELGEMIEG